MKLRIKFTKSGPVRFIGHLDIMRYFQKAIRRAEIDVAYSEGFSPHQIMSFAAPLGVGLTSDGEYLDIEVKTVTSSEDMKKKLNEVMVPGIEIVSIVELDEKAGNAMASVAAAKYTAAFREGYEPIFDWISQFDVFMEQPEILITKKTKKSETELNLKNFIFDIQTDAAAKEVHMLVDASSSGNIKPSMVMQAFMDANNEILPEFALRIHRNDTFTNVGSSESPKFVPLSEIGKEF